MKKTLHLFSCIAFIVLLCGAQKANAQVTAITSYYNDSSVTYCNTPAPVSGTGWYNIAGTIQANDSMTFYINFGDGTDTTFKDATQMQYTFAVNHTYMTTGTYSIVITLTNTNGVNTTVSGQTYVITNTCSALQGTVWVDDNSNCTYDPGESYLTGHTVKITNTTTSTVYYAYVDVNGQYNAEVPDGFTYDIEMAYLSPSLTPTCPVSGVVSQAVSGTSTYTNDLGYECNSNNTDFYVSGWANQFGPGFTRHMGIYGGTNNYCMTYPATITLTLDPLLSYVGTVTGTPPVVSGNVLTWTVTSLSQFNGLNSYMQIYCDPSAVLGDTLCNLAYITYSVTDTNTTNDTVNICRLVSNSWDPNDKHVSPMVGEEGWIENGELLTYLINFQNTGNDTAHNIVVVDSLSSDLDAATFQFVSATHPVNVTWLDGNVINFRFENIMLPDSNINEPLSHGSIIYKIAANTGLTPGTTINNTAHIYFDFNPAIVTNTTVNTIEFPTHVSNVTNGDLTAKVYPNPANNELTITTEGKDFTARVFDITGRVVAASVTNNGKIVINTLSLANGLYILTINADGKEMTTKVNVQH